MISLGELQLEAGKPVVAVSFTDTDSAEDIARARDAGVDLAELRIDLFADKSPAHVAAAVTRLKGLPTLATIRLAEEGGSWMDGEGDRIALFETILPLVDGVDIELRATEVLTAIGPQAQVNGKLVVVSHHDFEGTPPYEVLADVARRGAATGADIVKIATQVRSDADIAVLGRLLDEQPAPNLVVIGMGEAGLPTRIMFPREGSLFTFAAKGERTSAPGQISYDQLVPILARTL